MREFIYPSTKFQRLILRVEQSRLTLQISERIFTAEYPSIVRLDQVEKGYFDLMMHLLFYDLENIDLSNTSIKTTGNKKIVSYSGGADSTAVLLKFGGIPVHILRYWSSDYEQRQIRAVINSGGINISTDFEKIRTMYLGENKIGFNVGIGYGSMYFPMMQAMNANTIYFGVIFDDISFYYGKVFKYVTDFTNTRTYKLIQTYKSLGINIEFPMAGYSEVISTRIADSGSILNFSSCNTAGKGDKCLNCYKCFRKEAIRGKKINFDSNPGLLLRIKNILAKHPLKMASSTIYGIQAAGYNYEVFKNIDVSFLDRVNQHAHNSFFGGDLIEGYEFQTEKDHENISLFVDFINKHPLGFKI